MERASLETLNPAPGPAGDYLAAARRAAQATPAGKQDHAGDGPKLRGAVRVVAWGAALAAALAGGAIYYQMAGEKRAASREGHAATPRPSLHNPSAALVNPPPGSIAEAAQETEPHADAPAAPPASAAAPPAAESAPKPARAGPLHPTAAPAPAASSVTLEQAAAKGDALAQYDLALARYAAGDRAEGARLLRLSAAQNLAVAQYRLGKAYERGEGLTPNAVEARRWVERAAKSGNVKAMHDLGVYLARGEGAPLDEPAAFRWFLDAAEHGVVDSQFNLGVLYLQGRGADADSREAFYWFAVAAAGGDGDARSRATALEKQLGADAVATLRARARAFHAKPEIAQANGALGARPWASEALQAQATTPPRT
ncbi:MAG: tetratricopeptide repeat protein [Hyphomonadaceae bacterium]